jgi:hypothetical protein
MRTPEQIGRDLRHLAEVGNVRQLIRSFNFPLAAKLAGAVTLAAVGGGLIGNEYLPAGVLLLAAAGSLLMAVHLE